jgi:hypothetical protein
MVLDFTSGVMAESIKVTGLIRNFMESDIINGKMERSTRVNTQMIRNMAMVSILCRIIGLMRAGGSMASNMESVHLSSKMESQDR